MTEEIRQAIEALVDYNWADEERDFCEMVRDNGSAPESHIFYTLVRLRAYSRYTAKGLTL